jgi:hypothetical protein
MMSTVVKAFEGVDYTGVVVSYDNPYYKVVYSDGDSEEMSECEVRAHLLVQEGNVDDVVSEGVVTGTSTTSPVANERVREGVREGVSEGVPPQETLDIRGVLRWVTSLLSDSTANARLMSKFTPSEITAMIDDEINGR